MVKMLKADIALFYACLSPEIKKHPLQPVISGGENWETGFEETDSLLEMGSKLAREFEQRNFPGTLMPQINCDIENQGISDAMSTIMGNDDVGLIIVGLPEDTDMATFVLSSNCQKIIDWAYVPVLIVPGNTPLKNPEKVAFLANFDDNDTTHINALLNIVRNFSADIMASNINAEVVDLEAKEKQLLASFHDDVDYGKIYYRNNTESKQTREWNWLKAHKKCDMLTIIKQSRQSLKHFFNRANTPGAIYHLTIPLMILPEL
jgi:hypothetical protein